MSLFRGARLRTWKTVFLCAVIVTSSVVASAWPLIGSKETILIVGIPRSEETVWQKSLEEADIDYRYDESRRTLFTKENPIDALEAVREIPRIATTARRGLLERNIEKEFADNWPEVDNPRVCVAFPTPIVADPEDSEPISMVMAKGLEVSQIEAARKFVAERVPGMPWKNVLIMGSVDRSREPKQREGGRFLLTKSGTR